MLAVGALRGVLPLDGSALGVGAALLLSLPALSLPSLVVVRTVFPRDVLVTATGVVLGVSAAAGLVAPAV